MDVFSVRRWRHLLVVVCLTLAGVGLPATSASASGGTDVFAWYGAYVWTVPASVTEATVEAWGASGVGASAECGLGGYAKRVLPVTPGETLNVTVGRQGDVTAGINGGGARGGGDASDVRQGGYGLSDRVIVAGGGGGTDLWSCGGHGGELVSMPRTSTLSYEPLPTGGQRGGNGTATEGGTGGQRSLLFGGGNGGRGSLGQGGAGGAPSTACWPRPGGGGGGGYYGGGGGGGSGDSCSVVFLTTSGGGGGGGSSYAPGGELVPGVKSGDGMVVISWGSAAPLSNCSSGAVVDSYRVSSQGATFEVEVRDRPDEYEVCASLTTPSGMTVFDEHKVVKKDPTAYVPTYTPPSIDEDAPDGEASDSPCPQRTTGGFEKNGRAYLGSGADSEGNTVVCAGFRSSSDARHVRVTVY